MKLGMHAGMMRQEKYQEAIESLKQLNTIPALMGLGVN